MVCRYGAGDMYGHNHHKYHLDRQHMFAHRRTTSEKPPPCANVGALVGDGERLSTPRGFLSHYDNNLFNEYITAVVTMMMMAVE